MSKISTYSLADTPLSLSDRLIGTEAFRTTPTPTPLATKNFSLGELLQLFSANFPAASLQAVLNTGNTATQNINLTGTIDVTLIKPDNIEDTSGSQGTVFQYLSKGASSINWVDLPIDTLQAVLNAGNTATQNITLVGDITTTKIIPGNIQDDTAGIGTTGQFLSKTASGIRWVNSPAATTPTLGDVVSVGNTANQDIFINGLTIGKGSGTGATNTALGSSALLLSTTGYFNVATGAFTLTNNTTGNRNTALGYGALYQNLTGNLNVAIGSYASLNSQTGLANVALGYATLNANLIGSFNTGLGYRALFSNLADKNTAVGTEVMFSNTTGTFNTVVGQEALRANLAGSFNSIVGNFALLNAEASYVSALGRDAGRFSFAGNLNTASESIFIGYNSKSLNTSSVNEIVIGANAVGLGNNTIVLGSDSIVTTALTGNVGIGTKAPLNVLDVVKNQAGSTRINIENTDAAGTSTLRFTKAGGAAAALFENASNQFTFQNATNSGTLRFQTTTAGGSTLTALTVDSNQNIEINNNLRVIGALYDSTNSPGTLGQVLASTVTGTDWVSLSEITGVDGTGTANYVSKWLDANTITNSLIYDNGTNVGIGTASPIRKLDVVGAIRTNDQFDSVKVLNSATISNIPADASLLLYAPTTTGNYGGIIGWAEGNVAASISAYDAGSGGALGLSLATGNNTSISERMRITNTGNVGIGTTSPSTKLTVSDTNAITNQIDLIGYLSSAKGHIGEFSNGLYMSTNYFYNGSQNADNSSLGQAAIVLGAGATTTSFIDFNLSDAGANNPTSKVRIISNGNVGIGTTSPAYKLDIVGFANSTSGFRVTDGTIDNRISWSSGNVGFFGTVSNHPIAFNTNLSERMRITSTGNVGIGTSSPENISNTTTLTLNGSSGGGAVSFQVGGVRTGLINGNDNYLTLQSYASRALSLGYNGNNTLVISIGNNVGIGFTSPTEKLDVNGAIQIRGTRVNNSGEGGFMDYSAGRFRLLSQGQTNTTAGEFLFTVRELDLGGSVDALYIGNTGNVGIGTTAPSLLLQVGSRAGIGSDGVVSWGQALTGNNRGYLSWDTDIASVNAISNLVFRTNTSSERMRITSTGDVGIGTSAPTQRLSVGGNIELQGATATTRYIVTTESSTGTGRLVMQAGAGSAAFGGAINLYANSHPVYPGDVVAALSANGVSKFRINSSALDGGLDILTALSNGNVGIGTTAPSSILELNKTDSTSALGNSSGALTIRNSETARAAGSGRGITGFNIAGGNLTSTGNYAGVYGTVTGSGASGQIGSLIFATKSAITDTLLTERMTITSTGNVGIGTAAPIAKLHVANTLETEIRASENTNNNFIGLTQQATTSYLIAGRAGATPTQPLAIYTGGSERMRITSAGNVGIGTTAPVGRLDVRAPGPLSIDTAFRVRNSADSNNLMIINGEGGIGVGTTSPLPSAVLDINSTTQGFLPPRMTNAQRLAISLPAVGLMVYCTDVVEGLYIYKSTGWTFII
jgi:hypothetical protein